MIRPGNDFEAGVPVRLQWADHAASASGESEVAKARLHSALQSACEVLSNRMLAESKVHEPHPTMSEEVISRRGTDPPQVRINSRAPTKTPRGLQVARRRTAPNLEMLPVPDSDAITSLRPEAGR